MKKTYEKCIYSEQWPDEQNYDATYRRRLLQISYNTVCPTTIMSNVAWYFKAADPHRGAHTHSTAEVLAFFGTDLAHPEDLGGQITMYVNGEKHVMTKSFLVFAPPGMPHCPFFVDRVDRPMLHYAFPISCSMVVKQLPDLPLGGEGHVYDAHLITKPTPAPYRRQMKGEIPIVHMDGDVCPGAFVNTASWLTQEDVLPEVTTQNFDQLLLFVGSDPKDEFGFGAKVRFELGGEEYVVDSPSYVSVPSGVSFGNLRIEEMKKPIFFCRTASAEKIPV